MAILISNANPDPLYKQITDQIKNDIAGGTLKPGTKLPSVRGMAKDLNTSVITVKRAYTDLEAEGYIVTRPGLGTFVAEVDRDALKEEKAREIYLEIKRLLKSGERYGISSKEILGLFDKNGVKGDG